MATNIPPGGRVSNLMQTDRLLAGLRRSQAAVNDVQVRIAAGKQIIRPSEDPVLAGRLMNLSSLLGRLTQFKTATTQADLLLSSADTSLGEAADILRQAQSLAQEAVGTTASDGERSAAAIMVDALLGQMLRLANRTYQGRYLFDGQAGSRDPFVSRAGGIQYQGGADPFRLPLEPAWNMAVALDGPTVFGAHSSPAGAETALDPVMAGSTRVVDLRGAVERGVTLGRIYVDDGVQPPAVVDLSTAATVGDIIDLFNAAAPAGTTISLSPTSQNFVVQSVTPGANLTVTDLAGGTTARDLGITSAGFGPLYFGELVFAKLTTTTPTGLISGPGFDLASGIVITNGPLSATVSFATAQTVGDILNAINSADVGVRASIDPSGTAIRVVNVLSGAELRISENGGTTATDLGIRTFHGSVALASLAGGRGIGQIPGLADFRITQRDGTFIDVDLDSATTIADVIAAVNTAPLNTGDLVASISPAGGIRLVDSSVNLGNNLSVASLNMSPAAERLGLLKTVANPGATLVADDVSGVRTEGVFSHLLGLRDALAANNTAEIARQAALLEADLTNLTELRGTVGAQAAQVAGQIDHIDENILDTEGLLSRLGDLDLVEAAAQFQQLQSQLLATLMTTGRLLDVSLLDFLR